MNRLDDGELVKLKKQVLKLILMSLGDPSVSQIRKEAEEFNKAWKELNKLE